MNDVNPYESPKALPATSKVRPIKQGIGFVAVLFLTPLAIAVAFWISCGAVMVYANAAYPGGDDPNFPVFFWVAWLIFLAPPLLTLIAMVVWARRTYLARRQGPPKDEAAQEKDPSMS